ncbi:MULTISPECIES: LysR family transcriptional regulator [Vibrio]|uniref:LysR family transcriptional regulator n=2 Tax=Vibrio TaxID=662 RepID=A0A7X4LQA0_9VIBR|nr:MULTISPECIES: LysR family transcriptional regulator [Vibrio]MBF9003532.1 LysR family transcriptional regulator [Vibrio nitrifigilis]MZI96092.1 LysR family transcriptional regulator [Vibrio eleionomae]
MDLVDGLKAFVITAQTGSFTDAANRLGISNRLTSKYVAQLEDKIGARLLQRTTRQVGLTPQGEELLARAPALLAELDDLIGSVSEDAKGLTGLLRISAPVTFGEMYINEMLSRFAVQHPNLSIDLRLSDSHVDLAAEGFDIAFRIGKPDLNTLKVRKLGTITSVLIAGQSYLEQHGEPRSPDDLVHHTCILDTNMREANRWVFCKDGQESVFHPARNFTVNNARIAKDWAQNGLGIALCPSFVLQKYRDEENGNLVRLLSDYSMKTLPLCAAYLNGKVVPKKVRTLIDFAVQDFENSNLSACQMN